MELHHAGLFLVALIQAFVSAVVNLHQRSALSCVRFAFMINAWRLIYLRAQQQLGSPNQASINCAQKLKIESEKRECKGPICSRGPSLHTIHPASFVLVPVNPSHPVILCCALSIDFILDDLDIAFARRWSAVFLCRPVKT